MFQMFRVISEAENDIRDLNKQSKGLQEQLDKVKVDEQEIQDKISEDSKDLEKISTKISSLLKKVSVNPVFDLIIVVLNFVTIKNKNTVK